MKKNYKFIPANSNGESSNPTSTVQNFRFIPANSNGESSNPTSTVQIFRFIPANSNGESSNPTSTVQIVSELEIRTPNRINEQILPAAIDFEIEDWDSFETSEDVSSN